MNHNGMMEKKSKAFKLPVGSGFYGIINGYTVGL